MTEYASPWKEILDKYFAEFMQLCFPELYQAIDWVTPTKMLDKEFQQIAQESETGQRTVDKAGRSAFAHRAVGMDTGPFGNTEPVE